MSALLLLALCLWIGANAALLAALLLRRGETPEDGPEPGPEQAEEEAAVAELLRELEDGGPEMFAGRGR